MGTFYKEFLYGEPIAVHKIMVYKARKNLDFPKNKYQKKFKKFSEMTKI